MEVEEFIKVLKEQNIKEVGFDSSSEFGIKFANYIFSSFDSGAAIEFKSEDDPIKPYDTVILFGIKFIIYKTV